MRIKKFRARFWKWLYEIVAEWSRQLEYNADSWNLCPYGAFCKICEDCGRCTNHGDACFGMTKDELAASRELETERRA